MDVNWNFSTHPQVDEAMGVVRELLVVASRVEQLTNFGVTPGALDLSEADSLVSSTLPAVIMDLTAVSFELRMCADIVGSLTREMWGHWLAPRNAVAADRLFLPGSTPVSKGSFKKEANGATEASFNAVNQAKVLLDSWKAEEDIEREFSVFYDEYYVGLSGRMTERVSECQGSVKQALMSWG